MRPVGQYIDMALNANGVKCKYPFVYIYVSVYMTKQKRECWLE